MWMVLVVAAMRSGRFGVDPHAITTVARWRPGTARPWTVAELVATLRPQVLTFCRSCGTPAAMPREDAAVQVSVVEGRVVVSIRGADAVRRIFPSVPDSVTFRRRILGAEERSLGVAVERRDPDR